MCSIESRLGNDQSQQLTMIDSSSQPNSSGLATALRDRSSCSIPNQPNRSLPVRPAPHIPCRSVLPRRSLQTQSDPGLEASQSNQSVTTSSDRSRQDPTVGLIRIEVPSWHSDIRQPYINIVNLSTLHGSSNRGVKRKAPESEDNVTTSNCSLIDISQSPDRSDSSKDSPSSAPGDSPRNLDGDGTKKRRKRKLKKDEEKVEEKIEINTVTPSKIVPPLRLKKIQSLQEDVTSCAPTWGNLKKSDESQVISGFRFYEPKPPEPQAVKDTNYRIVTGTTPPYDECIDSSTVKIRDGSSEDKGEDTRCRQSQLKLKLRDLKKKTMELGREMLRTAMTSPDNCLQEAPVEEQIKKLTTLLKKLPEAAARADADCLEDMSSGPIVTSTIPSVLQGSTSSPEPPKLSPKVPPDYGNSVDVHQVRDSPPVLPKATQVHGEDTEDTWQEFEGLRGLLKISKKGKHENSVVASSVITTTSDSGQEEIELDNKSQILQLEIDEHPKSEINAVKLREQVKAIRIKSLIEGSDVEEVIKIDLRKTPSPGEMVIDTTSVLQEFENRSDTIDVSVGDSRILERSRTVEPSQMNSLRIQTPAPIISSSAEAPKHPNSLVDCLNMNNPKDLMIADHFPTLGNWLAKMSSKIPNETAKSAKKSSEIVIESRTPAYQSNIQMYNQVSGKNSGIDIGTSGRENGRQWRHERWENQEQRAQPPQEYVNGALAMNNVQIAMQNQQMTSDYCPPTMPLGRYYPRNYPVDPYGIPYGYNHPSLAASLWNGALLQYPFLRPRGLPQGYQPRFSGGGMQYNMPPGSIPQRGPPPSYPLPRQPQASGPPQEAKRGQPMGELSRNTVPSSSYDPTSLTKRTDYPSSIPQTTSYPNQRVQSQPQLPRDQYTKTYNEPNPRVAIPDAPRDQLNYRQSWRGPIIPPTALGMRNYPINTNWTSDPCSLLAALSPAALQNFSMPRVRSKDNEDTRNCETPHLGKVNYSPNTARTLECSNCALPGPLFKCLGCEVAFYCDETCQIRHWTRHVVSCPKKMPKLKKVVP
ncbi:uncharacterized protein [Fopius arisanus]|uniref:Uncharacterized protein isoform X1 n=2 Tax=Fopius arisanus TaxID=64838 RepID=A0A9R1TMQ3_9HYME|nr:PREDICTED: uncharacterized protein LOC105271858 isoform X1 [Fopius arisanus]XP_011311956.1 PREDICTED: uncharacterized protein LOC105271858 isoform X1 [Fopius arisanus]